MKLINLVLVVLFSWSAVSQADAQYAPVQCPATNDSVKVFRDKMLALKAAIKNEANCAPIKADIKHLDDILTKDRPKFIDAVATGQFEGLSEEEQGQVSAYVNDLTVTTYNLLAVVTGNDACFEEDKQGSSVEFLSSVISEGAKILSIVGGPELAPLIGVAGEAITGFMGAMQTISQNAIGYDFNKNDQQIAYADNLCALYDTRSELNSIVFSAESVQRLQLLQASLEKQVSSIAAKCPECAEMKGMVDAQMRDAGEIIAVDQVWEKDFDAQVRAKAKSIDAVYTNPIGTNMYRQLKTLSWIPIRINALRADEFNVDIVLSSVLGEMEEVEDFMVKNQGPKYMDSLIRDAEETVWKLNDLVNQQVYVLARNGGPQLEAYNGFTVLAGTYKNAEDFYGKLFDGLNTLRGTSQDPEVQDEISEFFTELDKRSRYMNVKLDVFDKYCTFFHQSLWGWKNAGIGNICNDSYVNDLKQQALLLTNYRMLMDAGDAADLIVLEVEPREEPLVAADWAEAYRKNLDQQAADVNYVERKSGLQ